MTNSLGILTSSQQIKYEVLASHISDDPVWNNQFQQKCLVTDKYMPYSLFWNLSASLEDNILIPHIPQIIDFVQG